MKTLNEIKNYTINKFREAGLINYQEEMLMIISHSMSLSKIDILTESNIKISTDKYSEIKGKIKRRILGEPTAQILGFRNFLDEKYIVDKNVLIPRFETEEIIDLFKINKKVNEKEGFNCLDIGTGSGVIAINIKKKFPEINVSAIDISKKALVVATKNAIEKKVNINFFHTSIENCNLSNINYILSNPPYIRTSKLKNLSKDLTYEPIIALDGGKDGTKIINSIFNWENQINKNNASLIILEIDPEIKDRVISLAKSYYPKNKIKIHKDLNYLDRFISIT